MGGLVFIGKDIWPTVRMNRGGALHEIHPC